MFCPKCNAELPEGMRFCMHCGEKIETPAEETPVEEAAAEQTPKEETAAEEKPFVLNLEGTVPEEPEKKKMDPKKKKLFLRITAGVTALAVLVVCLLGFFAWDWGLYVRDLFERMKSPEEYKNIVEQRALAGGSSELGAAKKALMTYYTQLKDAPQAGSVDTGVQLMLGDGLKDLLGQLKGLGLDEDVLALLQVLDKAELRLDGVMDGSVIQAAMELGLNGQELLGMQVTLDPENGTVYMQVPGLSENAVAIDMEEMDLDPAEYAALAEVLQMAQELKDDLPESEAVARLLDRCLLAALEQIEDVDRENDTIKAGGVSQKVTALTYRVSEKTFQKMVLAVLKEAENDETLLQLLKAIETYQQKLDQMMVDMGEDPVDATFDADQIMASISEAIDTYDQAEAGDEEVLIIETYVNRKGQIVGRSIRPEEEEGEITYLIANKGRKVGFRLLVDVDGEALNVEGKLDYRKGKLTGSGAVEFDGEELLILELEDFDTAACTGTVRVKLGEQLQEQLDEELGMAAMLISSDIALEIELKDKAATVWLMMGNQQMLGIGMDYAVREDGKAAVPEDAATDLEKWAGSLDPQVLLERLEKAGITRDMLQALGVLLEDAELL